jgi:hypothetical protein
MKKFIYSYLLLIFTFSLNAQTLNYSDLSSGTKPKGKFQQYISKDGVTFNVGDKINIGKPSSATGDYIYISCVTAMGDVVKLNANIANTSTEIKKIYVGGNKKSGFKSAFASIATGVSKYYYFIEDALESGEIKSDSFMTSDDALEKLKKAKDKLDLEVISKEEYEKIKAELVKFIK